jgi:Transketolase, thiamine diphosphate binding domain
LHLTGYPAMTIEEIKQLRQLGSRTAGHPEYGSRGGSDRGPAWPRPRHRAEPRLVRSFVFRRCLKMAGEIRKNLA